MPPRLRCPAARRLASQGAASTTPSRSRCAACLTKAAAPRTYATLATTSKSLGALRLPDDYVPPTQPPSARPPDARKSQLLRTYTSLLRSTPLILMFQHNNLTALEWMLIRRELKFALAKLAEQPGAAEPDSVGPNVKMEVVKTRMFAVALKVLEFFDPAAVSAAPGAQSKPYTHDLSEAAWAAVKARSEAVAAEAGGTPPPFGSSTFAQLEPLLVGPLALLTLPAVSPAHLAAALSVLAPRAPQFPAPTRRKNPGYHEPAVQNAVQKLLLVGGRIEGGVFDSEGVRWVGGIDGGMDGLRARLVALLQGAGLGVTGALEGAGRSLWLTMESRRSVLEEEAGGGKKVDGEGEGASVEGKPE